ncbi:hypothetical protein FACS1894109_06690 [Spirochaetia bacterium]|nr:hypothetical protein FACS1894109_06690 [Spirochaetia bacterium]
MNNKITIMQGPWIANMVEMTCRNIINKIVVSFTKEGEAITPKNADMPIGFLSELAKKENGARYMCILLAEAEAVFLRTCIEYNLAKEKKAKT